MCADFDTHNRVMSGTTSIIGATETTTSSGAAIIWGSLTYSPPVETETLGGSTTVIGGVTLPPAAVVVTPNPHPTTTPDPGTTDPVINSRKPSWTSGDSPEPTAEPGCPGCGEPCTFLMALAPFLQEPLTNIISLSSQVFSSATLPVRFALLVSSETAATALTGTTTMMMTTTTMMPPTRSCSTR